MFAEKGEKIEDYDFKPNPHLEVIEIHARLDLQLDYREPVLDKSWDQKYLQKYAKILKELKQLNPNLRLRLHDKETSLDKVTSFNDAYQKINRLMRNTKKFIDLAHENGIQVEYVFLRNVGLVPLNFWNSPHIALMLGLKKIFGLKTMKEMKNDKFKKAWQLDFLQGLAQKLDLNVYYDDLIGTHTYLGASIEFKQIFIFKHDEI